MAIKANLFIDQGTTYATKLVLNDADGVPVNLTGFSAAGQIRKHYSSSNAVSFSITLSPSTGTVVLDLSANTTANLVAGRYVYDVELTDTSGRISRIIEGIVTVSPNVTR
jgi:hypothetical protein